MTPPREIHADQSLPFHVLSHTALSSPRVNTWRRPGPLDATVGAAPIGRSPPRFCQPDHLPPANHLCHRCASEPRANTSIRPGPHDTAVGRVTRIPPREVHPLQVPPESREFSMSALFVPWAKTWSWALMEEADGPEAIEPPRSSTSDHPGGHAQLVCSRVPEAVLSNTSKPGPGVPAAPGVTPSGGDGPASVPEYVYAPGAVTVVPSGFVTVRSTVPVPGGRSTVIWVGWT